MRTSSYNIIVKVDDDAGRYALLNSYTHAFDIVNQNVYRYLKNEGSDCDISDETKKKLVKRGYITSLSKEDERELVKRLLDKIYDEVRLKNFGFHFIISYDCNLRCVYCYEDPILNGCACLPKGRISKEQVDKAYEIIVEKDKNKTGKKKVIHLYGGEPFLASNREMVEYIVEKGKNLGYAFSVTSNGYDLDKYLDFLEVNSKIFSFQITLDGIAEIQNKRKPHYRNKDSFERISANIDSLLKLGILISVRINTDTSTVERIPELLDFFFDKRGDANDEMFISNLEQSLLPFCRRLEANEELKSWAEKIELCFCSGVPWVEIRELENLLNKMANELYAKEFSETIEIKLLK